MKIIFNPKQAEDAIEFVFKKNPSIINKTRAGEVLYRLLKEMADDPDMNYVASGGFHILTTFIDRQLDQKLVDIVVTPNFENNVKHIGIDF